MKPRPPARMRLKYYMFDWDDNILHMPTRIHLERRTPAGWVAHDVSTAEFARVRRAMEGLRPPGNDWDRAFIDFYDVGRRGPHAFLNDTRRALAPAAGRAARRAPSFAAFKRALTEGRLFAIITARAHSPASIRKGVEYVIRHALTDVQRRRMLANLRRYIAWYDGGAEALSDRAVLDRYLSLCQYVGVSSPDFQRRMGGSKAGSEQPERAKQIAIQDFVRHAVALGRRGPLDPVISVGFSDDDDHNVRAATRFIREELARAFPGVRFAVYNTAGGRRGVRKSVIQRGTKGHSR